MTTRKKEAEKTTSAEVDLDSFRDSVDKVKGLSAIVCSIWIDDDIMCHILNKQMMKVIYDDLFDAAEKLEEVYLALSDE